MGVAVGSGVAVAASFKVGVAVGSGKGAAVGVGVGVGSGVGVGAGPTRMLEAPPTGSATLSASRMAPEKEWGPSALGTATVYVKRSSPSSVKATAWPSTSTAASDRSELS